MPYPAVSDADFATFWQDGYVLKPGFFDREEVGLLHRAIELDEAIRSHIAQISDSQGATTELALWNHPGDDLFGMVARAERMVGGMERLLGGEVYHYHSKLTMKRPRVGGAWDWHQDYGYWYYNGCLEVIRGSHKMGRIEHGRVGGQTGADIERVNQAMKVLDHVYVEMEPGDALFFHSNLLHCSSQNRSEKPRNVLLCCYNRASNNPTKVHHHPQYTPLARVPDARIKEVGLTLAGATRQFWSSDDDKTVVEVR